MDLLFKEKLPVRVPRASNLNSLRILFKSINDYRSIEEIYKNSIFNSKASFNEYWKLLIYLDWIVKIDNRFSVKLHGLDIQSKLSDGLILTKSDIQIFKSEFTKLYFVRRFLKEVFDYDLTVELPNKAICLNKEEIEYKYMKYREVSPSVSSRESRLIYNWLIGIGIIESITTYKRNEPRRSVYHLTINELKSDTFVSLLRLIYPKIINSNGFKNEWVELPLLRYYICIPNFISKECFDNLLYEYVKRHPEDILLSTGSLLRKEVENEGFFLNNKVYFYLKLI